MKNTMFQFATNNEIFNDTGLITAEESLQLFKGNRAKFIRELELGRNPEMCIWIDCDTDSSYGETSLYWIADDFQVIDGELWQRV